MAGHVRSPTGEIVVELKRNSMGGGLDLFTGTGDRPIARDVTAVGWLSPDEIVVSTSPVYGLPGLYVHDFRGDSMSVLVPPKRRNAAYPDGADYFRLHRLVPEQRVALFFHALDVDSMDTRAAMDGSSLESVSVPERRGRK